MSKLLKLAEIVENNAFESESKNAQALVSLWNDEFLADTGKCGFFFVDAGNCWAIELGQNVVADSESLTRPDKETSPVIYIAEAVEQALIEQRDFLNQMLEEG